MKFAAIGCGVLLVIVGIVVMIGVGGYNRLVSLEEGVDSAWGQVENVYQRRADLIPNLVATVKGSAEFESRDPDGGCRGPREGRPGQYRKRSRRSPDATVPAAPRTV